MNGNLIRTVFLGGLLLMLSAFAASYLGGASGLVGALGATGFVAMFVALGSLATRSTETR